jgi:hypothetical protein
MDQIRTAACIALFATLAARNAYADGSAPACAAAYEHAQTERKAGHLDAARQQLVSCAAAACPGWMVKDCLSWAEDVERATPSVILDVTVDGERATAVEALLDGKPWIHEITGRALPLEPGGHTITFVAPGFGRTEKKVVVNEGEKLVRVQAVFEKPRPAAPPVNHGENTASRPVPAAAWVLGGLGVAALGAGSALLISANSERSNLEGSCKPFCNDDSVDSLKVRYLAANVAFGVGALSAATALILYVGRRSEAKGPAAGLVVLPTATGAQGMFRTVF